MNDLKPYYIFLDKCYVDFPKVKSAEFSKLFNLIINVRNLSNELTTKINEVNQLKNRLSKNIKNLKKILENKMEVDEFKSRKLISDLKLDYKYNINELLLNDERVRTKRSFNERYSTAEIILNKEKRELERKQQIFQSRNILFKKKYENIINQIYEMKNEYSEINIFLEYANNRLENLKKTKEDINTMLRLVELEKNLI